MGTHVLEIFSCLKIFLGISGNGQACFGNFCFSVILLSQTGTKADHVWRMDKINREGQLTVRREDILKKLDGQRLELVTAGVKSLALFGSLARDEAIDSSDVDLLVEFALPTGLLGLIALKHALERALEVDKVDLLTPGTPSCLEASHSGGGHPCHLGSGNFSFRISSTQLPGFRVMCMT